MYSLSTLLSSLQIAPSSSETTSQASLKVVKAAPPLPSAIHLLLNQKGSPRDEAIYLFSHLKAKEQIALALSCKNGWQAAINYDGAFFKKALTVKALKLEEGTPLSVDQLYRRYQMERKANVERLTLGPQSLPLSWLQQLKNPPFLKKTPFIPFIKKNQCDQQIVRYFLKEELAKKGPRSFTYHTYDPQQNKAEIWTIVHSKSLALSWFIIEPSKNTEEAASSYHLVGIEVAKRRFWLFNQKRSKCFKEPLSSDTLQLVNEKRMVELQKRF